MISLEYIDTLNQEAWELNRKDPAQAYEQAEQAYQLARTADYAKGIAYSLTNLARLHHYRGENTQALSEALEAASLFEQMSLSDEMYLHSLDTLSTLLVTFGNYADGLGMCLKLLRVAETMQHQHYQAWTLNHIGIIYFKMGDFPKALDFFTRCLQLSQEIHYPMLTAGLHGNIAETLYKLGQLHTALEMVSTGLQLANEIQDSDLEFFLLLTKGEIYAQMESNDEALTTFQYLLEQIDLVPPIRVQHHRIGALYNRALIFLKQERLEEAISSFDRVVEMAAATGEKAREYMGHEQLARLYEQKGDFTNALRHYKAFHRLKEALFNVENAERINGLTVLHQTETARKEAEFYRLQADIIEKNRQYFEKLSRMKDEVLHSTSHDLKNPLSAIKTYTYLLRRHLPPNMPQLERYTASIEASTEQMRGLIQNLLDLAALEAQQLPFKQTINLNDFLRPLIQEFETQAQQKSIRLNFLPDVGQVLLNVNPDLLKRVFQNLLSNALKYTRAAGQIEITTCVEEDTARIRVKDTGIGIPPGDLPHIFEKFYRIRDNQHMAAEGTGLGLAIAKEIVGQHGGSIHVTSTLGLGSEFEVILPLL
ncbi:MAG: tetratricopeptide repeat-containing sensor histidine kinase [Anaerolineae bacterium]|nr:tetratricopeptide repeat-containing sensor histidine kinase [Anaerolineae bacterium]